MCEAPAGPFRQKTPDPFFTGNGRPYFVMELVKGQPITEYCDQHRLTPRERLDLFLPVCQAVQHAHQKGIIHRDIKPSNILVAEYDQQAVPKVIDFGVAKAVNQPLTEKTMFTALGQIVGTLEYMSPEQAKVNQLDIDTRTDVYALGVLLYELLTGTTPFDKQRLRAAAWDEMLRIIREEEPPKPSTRLSDSQHTVPSISADRHTEPAKLTKLVRGELDWIVMKALEKDRARRYDTASALAADIGHYLHDEPVVACPPSAVYRFRKFARRNKAALGLAAMAALALLLIVGAVGGSMGWMARDRAARQARVSEQVGLILDEVARFEQQQQWPEALVAAQRAEPLLASGEAPQDVHVKVQQVISDLKLVARLEEIRLLASEATERGFNYAGANLQYAAALREYGIDVDALPADEAIRLLQSRAEVLPALIIALDDWAACRLAAEDAVGAKALAEFAKALDADPWRRRLRETRADGSEQTLDELVRSEEVTRQPPSTIELLAGELQHRGRSEDALEVLGRAWQDHPDDFWLHTTAAIIHGSLSRPPHHDEAIRHYTAALALRPRSAVVRYNLGNVLKNQGRLDEAIACYRRALELDPKCARAHTNLGNALRAQGQLDEAIICLHRAIDLDPQLAPAHMNLGIALKAQGRLDEAIASYREAIALNPQVAMAHYNLGIALQSQRNFDEAVACYRRAIELDPTFALAHNNLAATLLAQGNLDEATDCLRRAVTINPLDAMAHYNLGIVLQSHTDFNQAIACYRRAIELDPQFALAHNNLGASLAAQGNFDEAIAAYRQAIEINPKLASAYNNLAWVLATANDSQLCNPSEATNLARTAVQLDPQPWAFWDTLSVAAYRAADWTTSLEARQEKLRRRPTAADDLLFLAMTHWQLGNKAEARQSYDEAIAEVANQKTASAALRSLLQDAEQLLGITTSPTLPERVEPTGEEPLP